MRKKLCILFCLFSIILGACEAKYETITDKPGNYKYGLGEEVSIIDVETREKLGVISLDSCELVSEEPFRVRGDADENEEDKVYVKLYRIVYSYEDSKDFMGIPGDNFQSEDSYFVINPKERPIKNSVLEIGVLENYNKRDTAISLSFRYDTLQDRATAYFEIPIENVGLAENINARELEEERSWLVILVIIETIIIVMGAIACVILRREYVKMKKKTELAKEENSGNEEKDSKEELPNV